MSKKSAFFILLLLIITPFAAYYTLNIVMPYAMHHYSPPALSVREQSPTPPPVIHKAQLPVVAADKAPAKTSSVDTPLPGVAHSAPVLSVAAQPAPAPQSSQLPPAPAAVLNHAQRLTASYDYDAAKALLATYAQTPEVRALIRRADKQQQNLQEYPGDPVHIFFHSLIIDPEKAFNSPMAKGYNLWMTTVKEFKVMLDLLLAKGYVLYPPSAMLGYDSQGQLIRKPIYLPPGKKPLVLSVDDINYYGYMKNDGFAKRLVAVNDGRVLTEVEQDDGTTLLTEDGDVVPILEAFTQAHPEFSYQGYKGILAVTGYEGAFGYRLNEFARFAKLQKPKDRAKLQKHTPAEEAQMAAEVRALAAQLRVNGWDIASHSFTHNSYFRTGKITLKQLRSEDERFNSRIAPYIGKPFIFIPPFGMPLSPDDPRYRYLSEEGGYLFYMPVASNVKSELANGMLWQNRLNLDGYTLLYKPQHAAAVFTPEEIKQIVDPARPKISL